MILLELTPIAQRQKLEQQLQLPLKPQGNLWQKVKLPLESIGFTSTVESDQLVNGQELFELK